MYFKMKIKICGIFRYEDIEYINEAHPDYIGFVFAPSKRKVSPTLAAGLRARLTKEIITVGVFVNAPVKEIISLYQDGVISIAQLHGSEDKEYIEQLKEESMKISLSGFGPIPVIKVIRSGLLEKLSENTKSREKLDNYSGSFIVICNMADYLLIDSGAGCGKTFDWNILSPGTSCSSWLHSSGKKWFLAGGINMDNVKAAMGLNPFCIDISGGAETDGIKDRKKVIQLTSIVRKGSIV